jgi:uncharacterized protein YydD (DUF2326 family)
VILSISSDLPTFKSLTFHAGLNVLVADRTQSSTDGQTRNSAGKTSTVEVIHFLLGSDVSKAPLFRVPAVAPFLFRARLRLGPHEITVARKGSDANRIHLSGEDAERIGVALTHDPKTGVSYLPVKRWREILGHFWFGLPYDPNGTPFGEKFSPGFRSLVSYFARRNQHGGYTTPEKYADKQATYDYQVNLSYLIGLDWSVPQELEGLRVDDATIKELKKAIRDGAFGQIFGSVAEIRPEMARIDNRMERLRRQIDSFEVLEDYREFAAQAAQAKRRMQEISLRLVQERQALDHLERIVVEERPPEYTSIEKLYRAAGVELPGVALRRFEDVALFQKSVVENRRAHLQEQIDETQARIDTLESEMGMHDRDQAAILRLLDGKGALEDHRRMSEELASLESQAAILREKLRNAELLEGKKTQLQKERATLLEKLQADHHRHESELHSAILKVDRAISDLYDDRKGNFIIKATAKGPEFRITIQGDGNRGGIDRMEVFCFDLMLFETAAERFEGGPGFLMHDSHLFDGVDPRQMRSAVTLGTKAAERFGGQYIIAVNSDTLTQLSDVVDEKRDVLRPRLSDDEGGGLFGLRFTLS